MYKEAVESAKAESLGFVRLLFTGIFGVVVGALAAGWATPTECAALGAFATMCLAALYRVLRWEKDGPVFRDPARWPALVVSQGVKAWSDIVEEIERQQDAFKEDPRI